MHPKMGFQFRYDRLLHYRERLKEKAEIELTDARGRLNLARQAWESTNAARDKAEASFRAGLERCLGAAEVKSHSDYMRMLKERISLQAQEMERLEAQVSEKRKAVLQTSRDVKIFEKLKERDLQKWQRQQEDLERKRLNEVGILRHGREFV